MPQPWPTVSADHAKVTSRRRRGRRGHEAAGLRLAEAAQVGEILEEDAVEDALAARQPGEYGLRGEVGGLERRRTGDAPQVGEPLGGRVLDEHPRRPVAAAPDHERGPGRPRRRRCRDGIAGSEPVATG